MSILKVKCTGGFTVGITVRADFGDKLGWDTIYQYDSLVIGKTVSYDLDEWSDANLREVDIHVYVNGSTSDAGQYYRWDTGDDYSFVVGGTICKPKYALKRTPHGK